MIRSRILRQKEEEAGQAPLEIKVLWKKEV